MKPINSSERTEDNGELPNGWEVVSFDDAFTIAQGQVDPKVEPYASMFHIGPENVESNSGYLLPCERAKDLGLISGKYHFFRGDIVYSKIRPYLNKVAMPDFDGICSADMYPLRASACFDARFLFHYLLSDFFLRQVMPHQLRTGIPKINREQLQETSFPKPTLNEQQKIAHVLDASRAAITVERRAEELSRELRRAVMNRLFTRGLQCEVQKETEIGLVPESWTVEQLGNIAEIAYGAQAAVANATDPSIGTLILTNVNLDLEGHINLEKRRYYKIPEAHRDRLSLKRGDVLFNWRSGSADHVGKTVYFDEDGEFTYSSFILRFRPYKSVTSKFLFRWLTHLRINGFFTSQRNVSSINSVYNASLSATIPIWFPGPQEQEEITTILDALDRKIALHRQKRAVLEDLLKSLLHKLMTGEIRAGELELSALSSDPPRVPEVMA